MQNQSTFALWADTSDRRIDYSGHVHLTAEDIRFLLSKDWETQGVKLHLSGFSQRSTKPNAPIVSGYCNIPDVPPRLPKRNPPLLPRAVAHAS